MKMRSVGRMEGNMRIDIVVQAEIEAAMLLWPPYGAKGGSSQSGADEFHEAGNKIIALAERIKAERAVAAMQVNV